MSDHCWIETQISQKKIEEESLEVLVYYGAFRRTCRHIKIGKHRHFIAVKLDA